MGFFFIGIYSVHSFNWKKPTLLWHSHSCSQIQVGCGSKHKTPAALYGILLGYEVLRQEVLG